MTFEESAAAGEISRFKAVLNCIRQAGADPAQTFDPWEEPECRNIKKDEVRLEKSLLASEPRLLRIWMLEHACSILDRHHKRQFGLARDSDQDAWIAEALADRHDRYGHSRWDTSKTGRNPINAVKLKYAWVDNRGSGLANRTLLVGFLQNRKQVGLGSFEHWQLDFLNDSHDPTIKIFLGLAGGVSLVKRYYSEVHGVRVTDLRCTS
ncbi:unnamed protein product, partial [Polarella glacialis]